MCWDNYLLYSARFVESFCDEKIAKRSVTFYTILVAEGTKYVM